jgi:hypothetical protein
MNSPCGTYIGTTQYTSVTVVTGNTEDIYYTVCVVYVSSGYEFRSYPEPWFRSYPEPEPKESLEEPLPIPQVEVEAEINVRLDQGGGIKQRRGKAFVVE